MNKGKDPEERESLEQVRRTLKKHRDSIMGLKNVVGVGIGKKEISREKKAQLCIRVFVRKKVPRSKLDPSDCIPGELEGIPVCVEETGEIRAL